MIYLTLVMYRSGSSLSKCCKVSRTFDVGRNKIMVGSIRVKPSFTGKLESYVGLWKKRVIWWFSTTSKLWLKKLPCAGTSCLKKTPTFGNLISGWVVIWTGIPVCWTWKVLTIVHNLIINQIVWQGTIEVEPVRQNEQMSQRIIKREVFRLVTMCSLIIVNI